MKTNVYQKIENLERKISRLETFLIVFLVLLLIQTIAILFMQSGYNRLFEQQIEFNANIIKYVDNVARLILKI